MDVTMKKKLLALPVALALLLTGCSSPQERARDYLRKGDASLASHQIRKAEIEYQAAIKNDSHLLKAYMGLASIAEQRGDWQNLYRYTSKIVQLDPSNVQMQIKLGTLYVLGQQFDQANSLVSRLERQVGDKPEVLTFKAIVQMREGNTDAAMETATKAIAADPHQADAYSVLAQISSQNKDYSHALDNENLGLRINPNDLTLQMLKLDTLSKMGDRPAEVAMANTIAATHPDDENLIVSVAKTLSADRQLDAAEAILRQSTRNSGDELRHDLEMVSWLDEYRGAAMAEQEARRVLQHLPGNVTLEFALYNALREQKKDQEAVTVLQSIIGGKADKVDVQIAKMMLATIDVSHHDLASARKLMNDVLQEDPSQPQALLLRAGFEIDAGQYDQALADLRTLTKEQPNSSQAWALMTQVYNQIARPDLAMQTAQRAFDTSGQAPKYGLMYHAFLEQHDQLKHATEVLQDMLSKQPDYVPGLLMLARSQVQTHDYAGATATVARLEAMPGTAPVPGLILAQIELETGQAKQALARLHGLQTGFPTDRRVVIQLIQTLLAVHDTAAAQSALNAMLKQHLDDVTAWLLQSQLDLETSNLAGAVKSLQQSIASQPDAPVAYRHLADLYLQTGQFPMADTVLHQGLSHNPSDADLLLLQAEVHESTQPAVAVSEYRSLLSRMPNNLLVLNNLVCALDQMPDQSSWHEAAKIAAPLQGTRVPSFDDTYGWANFKAGKLVNAEQSLRAAAAKMPQNASVLYHLAATLAAAGQTDEAKKLATSALKYAGNDENLRANLQALQK